MKKTATKKMSATELKSILWNTLQAVSDKQMQPDVANSIAAQSREILRTTKIQLHVLGQANKAVTQELVDFAQN